MLVLLVLRGLRRVGCWTEFVLRCVMKSVVRGMLLLAPAGCLLFFVVGYYAMHHRFCVCALT